MTPVQALAVFGAGAAAGCANVVAAPVIGALVGASLGRRLPPAVLRAFVVLVAVVAIVRLVG